MFFPTSCNPPNGIIFNVGFLKILLLACFAILCSPIWIGNVALLVLVVLVPLGVLVVFSSCFTPLVPLVVVLLCVLGFLYTITQNRIHRRWMRFLSKAAPHNSASRFGERFFVKSRFEKCRNTLCISNFSNRRIGGKDPPKRSGAIVRCCL